MAALGAFEFAQSYRIFSSSYDTILTTAGSLMRDSSPLSLATTIEMDLSSDASYTGSRQHNMRLHVVALGLEKLSGLGLTLTLG